MDYKTFVLHQLYVLKNQVDSLINVLEQLVEDEIMPEPTICQHPIEKRINLATMDDPRPRWFCRVCGYEHEPEEDEIPKKPEGSE